MTTTNESLIESELPASTLGIATAETSRIVNVRAESLGSNDDDGACIDTVLGISLHELSLLSSLLRSSVSRPRAAFAPPQMPPLGLVNACPLACGETIGTDTEAIAVFEKPWLSAISAMHFLGHRFARAAVDRDLDLHRVFHPLWRQTTNLAFAAELLARVLRRSEASTSWLAGLCFGIAGMSSAIQSTKPGSPLIRGLFPSTSMADIDRLTRELEVDSLIPLPTQSNPSDRRAHPWRVAATAARLLQEVSSEDKWMLTLPTEIEPLKVSAHVRNLLRERLSAICSESQRMNSVLWQSPLMPAHR